MPQSIPPMRGLQVFEAVARYRSVSRAAAELCVTQPAVTQQLRRLESYLELQLVERSAGGIALTLEGEGLARRLSRAFDEVRAAIAEVDERRAHHGIVSVAVLATFAQRWLITRLVGFQEAHPEIEVRLLTTSRMIDLKREDVDVSIRCGDGAWPDCRVDALMQNEIFPVASPALLAARPITSPSDLAHHVWLYVDADPRRGDWDYWASATDAPNLCPANRISFSSSVHALEAAVAGLGVAMTHTPFVVDALNLGRLSAPLPAVAAGEGAYYLVSDRSRADLPKVSAFRDWVLLHAGE